MLCRWNLLFSLLDDFYNFTRYKKGTKADQNSNILNSSVKIIFPDFSDIILTLVIVKIMISCHLFQKQVSLKLLEKNTTASEK